MTFTDQHKALALTLLISGTVVLTVFNMNIIKQQAELITESYYELEPEEVLTEEELEKIAQEDGSKAETNKAFNESNDNKRLAQAYKTIAPPEDYVRPDLSSAEEGLNNAKESIKVDDASRIDKAEFNSFNKVNDILKKQQEDGANAKSTMSYSLVNRKHLYLPTPIYLCEQGGKVVVNITVNSLGKVIDSYLNNSSKSSNKCLIEHALEYSKKARFNSGTKDSQIGSITFYFASKG